MSLERLKRSLLFITASLLLTACGSSKSYAGGSMEHKTLTIYNQAYSDHNNQDKLKDIISKARDSYILVDPFDLESDGYKNLKKTLVDLKAKNNLLSAYISIGTAEDWRDDFKTLKRCATNIEWKDWKGEFFITDSSCALPVMKERIDKIAKWGFEYVEFDNMDWFSDDEVRDKSGKKITPDESTAKDYANSLCSYAHLRGLKCMAKNIISGFDSFDGVLYESYPDDLSHIREGKKPWWDDSKSRVMSFLNSGKIVIINHYDKSKANCDKAFNQYKNYYSDKISFICEASREGRYIHY